MVQAFEYGPFIPVVENPIPFLFNWITLVAVFLSGLSMIRMRQGSVLSPVSGSSTSKTTYPPLPPVISCVAFSTFLLISLLALEATAFTLAVICAFSFAACAANFGLTFPSTILVFAGFAKPVVILDNKNLVFNPCGLLTISVQYPSLRDSTSTPMVLKSTALNSIVSGMLIAFSRYALAFASNADGSVTSSNVCEPHNQPYSATASAS